MIHVRYFLSNPHRIVGALMWYRGKLIALYHLCVMIVRKHKDECYIIMSTSIGDDVYGMAYVRDMKEKNKKRIIVYVHEHKRKLIENYGVVDEIRSFPKKYKGWIRINYFPSLINLGKKHGIYSIMPYHYIPMEKNNGRDCLKIIRESLLGLDFTPQIQYPDFSQEPIVSLSDIERDGNKIIILNYSSQFMKNVDMALFQAIADELTRNGFKVYTNVVGTQKPLNNTFALNCSFYELYAISNKIKAIISVRSGILDLCANTKAAFLVYNFPFPGESDLYNEEWMHRFDVSAWGKKNMIEILCKGYEQGMSAFHSFKTQYLQ